MKEIYKYLYAVSAACMIGMGSGFISLSPYLLKYDKEVYHFVYEVEAALDYEMNKNTDCAILVANKSSCKEAVRLINGLENYLELLELIIHYLLVASLFTLIGGIMFHSATWFLANYN